MACRGICEHYRTKARYDDNHKRCRICDIFIVWEGMRCPCCSFGLRTKARSSKKTRDDALTFTARYS